MKIATIAPRDLQLAIIADGKEIEALKEEWNNLYMRAEQPYLSQSFEWAWCAWRTIAEPRGQRPCFVVIRSGNRIVLSCVRQVLQIGRGSGGGSSPSVNRGRSRVAGRSPAVRRGRSR